MEKTTLQSILYELSGQSFSTKKAGRKLFADAINYSKSHYSINEKLQYSPLGKEVLSRTKFTVDIPNAELELIRAQLLEENILLEGVIYNLQNTVEKVTLQELDEIPDIMESANTMKIKSTIPSTASSKIPGKTTKKSTSEPNTNKSYHVDIGPNDSILSELSPTSYSPLRAGSSGGSGHFRARLLHAQTEAFLRDDDENSKYLV
jgi:hypothetical protein